jgi:uncharacterized protein (TIGR03000 family)
MYSVVMMMALTGSAETTELGNRCCGCSGGRVAHGCSGFGRCHGREHHRCSGSAACCGVRNHNHGCAGRTCAGSGCFGGHRHNRCCGAAVVNTCCGTAAPTGDKGAPPAKKEMPKVPMTEAMNFAPATIIVMLPANARLTVDGATTISTAARRIFVTPALEVGSDYVYNLTAEIIRDGKTITESQSVTVTGGRTNEVVFNFPVNVESR